MLRSRLIIKNYLIIYKIQRNLLKNFSSLCRLHKFHRSDYSPMLPSATKTLQIRSYSSDEDLDGPSEESEVVEEQFENDLDGSDSDISLKDLMYPNSTDPLIRTISEYKSEDEILDIFVQNKELFNAQHFTQSIILLWENRRTNPEKIKDLNRKKEFVNLIETLNSKINEMTIDEAACNFMYLGKLEVDVGHPVMTNLLLRCTTDIKNEHHIPLTALSRFSVAVGSTKDLYKFLVCKDVLPHLERHIQECQSSNSMRLITICLHNVYQQATEDLILLHKEKINELIEKEEISNKSAKCILKLINFLIIPNWSNSNTPLIRKLILLLDDELENLSLKGVETILKVLQSQLEPASVICKLSKIAENNFKVNPTPEMFACATQFITAEKREKMANVAKQIILSKDIDTVNLPALFRAIRLLKISDSKTCDAYWNRVIEEIDANAVEKEPYRLLKYCHRYMHFNNNLGGTYRHHEYEEKIFELVINELKNGLSSMCPSLFAKFSSFVIAYGDKTDKSHLFPYFMLEKMKSMCSQFSIVDCLYISRGLQIALEMRYRKFIPQDLALQINRIQNCLNTCTERFLESKCSLNEINCIIRSYNNRKASRKTNLYERMMKLYETIEEPLNSRNIRDITLNLNTSNYILPDLLSKLFDYILKNRDYVFGDTVEKVLHCSYNLGYVPDDEEVLHWCSEIIKRDFDYMSGLSILQACLALSFYKSFSEGLINKVFSIDFIQRVEDEIQSCYSKATYPERVLNQVMQLNRAVCLEFPEAQVPWFQQNYIEAQMTKSIVMKSRFHEEVNEYLMHVVQKKEMLRRNHVTPYGYRIDFVLHFDSHKNIIPPPADPTSIKNITKIGILLLKVDAFCENNPTILRGPESLKMRHLEMLGYKVIHITLNDWNSMYMNVPGAKTQYLKNLLKLP